MSAPVLLGVDVGSSGAKTAAVDTRGRILARGRADYETSYPRDGWAEQNPEDWFEGACTSIRSCLEAGTFRAEDVAGIALVGPAHNAALLDENDRTLRPCIHWSDLRSEKESRSLQEAAGETIFSTSGQPVNPSWTLSQLAWLRTNEPAVWDRLSKVLVTKDYVRYRFTGEYATDPYDAVGTQLFDLGRSSWSDALCGLIGLDPRLLPPILPSHAAAGRLRPEVAARLRLDPGIFIAVGGGDSSVEAFGAGAAQPGDCIVKIGTSACFNVVTRRATPSRRTLTYPYLFGDLGFTIAVTSNGTAALKWLRARVLEGREMSFEEITRRAASAPAGANGLVFHPYLMGERTPYWDPRLRGAFIGLGTRHGLVDMARAVLEGVAFTLRDCMDAARDVGAPTDRLWLLGGGSRSQVWASITASVLNRQLLKPQTDDAAVGAALLAGVGSGAYRSVHEACDRTIALNSTTHPDAKHVRIYDDAYSVYRELYRQLKPANDRLSALATTQH